MTSSLTPRDAVSTQLVAGMPASASNTELISEYGAPQTPCQEPPVLKDGKPVPCSWTAAQLRDALFDERHDVIFLAGHFSSNEALAADFTTRLNVSELAASSVDLTNSLVFSNGCHSGYNLVDGAAITGVTEPLDWAQAFARKGATLIAGTGYQYGDTDFLEYSERIYAEFAHQLRVGTGPVAVGDALVAAKLFYMSTTQSLSGLHEKSVLEAALFGLPMFKVNMTGTRDTSPGSGPESLTLTDPVGGLSWADLDATPSTQQHNKPLDVLDVNGATTGSVMTTWFSGKDDVSLNPGDPVLPLDVRNVTKTGKVLRGVVFLGGSYTDKSDVTVSGTTYPVVPLTATAGTELGGTHLAFGSPTFYPERPWSVNYFDELAGGSTNLLLTPAQHRVEVPGDSSALLRLYSNLDLRLYYLDASVAPDAPVSTALAPSISGVKGTVNGNSVTFQANVIGDPTSGGALAAWITYTLGPDSSGNGTWTSVPLNPPGDASNVWTSAPVSISNLVPGKLRFMAQAASKGGAVAIDTNFGQYYGVSTPTVTSSLALALSPDQAAYGTSTQATATLTPAVEGRTITFRLGSATRTANTNGSGVAVVTLPLQVTPGAYTATASFAGDETHVASSATFAFIVDKIDTATEISHDPAYPLQAGAESGVKAVVTDGNGDPLAFRTLFFVVATYPEGTDGYTVTRLTDGTGTAYLGPIPTPFAGGRDYAINAYYASPFSSVPDASEVDTTDLVFEGSSARLPVSGGVTIEKGDQTITFDPIPPKTFGDAPFAVSATASSGLPVSLSSSTPLTCTVSGSLVTLLAAGDCTITASQAGDDTWKPAESVSQTVSAAKAAAVVTLDCATGGPFTYTGLPQTPCTASATDGVGNPITVSIDITYNGDPSALGAGDYPVVATVDDLNYQGQATDSVTVGKATLTVTPDDQSITAGSDVPPTSFYTFAVTGFVNETDATAPDYVAPTCASEYATTTSGGSSLPITCSAGSADNYTFDTTATATLTVTRGAQATLAITGPTSATYGGADQAITTSGGSGTGAVTFDAGSSTACSIVAGKLHVVTATGTCTITATKAGDASYLPTTSAPFDVTINKASTSITTLSVVAIAPNPTAQFSDTVTLRAEVSPAIDGTVSFQLNGNPSTPVTATVSAGVAQATLRLDASIIPNGAGTYALSATFTPTGGNYASSTLSQDVPIQREGQQAGGQPDGSSRIDYTGDQYVVVGSAPTLRAALLQSRPPESTDTELVDFSTNQVEVVFTVYPAGCPTPTACPTAAWTSAAQQIAADGTASVAPPADTLREGAYIVVVAANANGYILPLVATSALVVSSTGNTYISGGGFVTTDSTANTENTRGHFAFNSSKSSGTVEGSAVYVYRMRIDVATGSKCTAIGPTLFAGCRDVDVIIRSMTQTTLNAGQKGYLTGKVTVQYLDAADPTKRYAAFEYSGGDFRLDIVDNSQAGTPSAFGLTAYKSNGKTVFHEASTGSIKQTGIKSVTNTVIIGGGYISSHP